MIWYLHVSLIVSQNSPHSLIFSHVCAQSLSYVQHFATPGTVARQAPLSMGFPRQEHWSGLPFPSLGDLPRPGIKPASPACIGRWILYHWATREAYDIASYFIIIIKNNNHIVKIKFTEQWESPFYSSCPKLRSFLWFKREKKKNNKIE